MKLIICLALVTCCLAAPVAKSENVVDLSEMELEFDPDQSGQPLVGIVRASDLDPQTRGVYSDAVRAPIRTTSTTADGQPVYAIQLGPYPLLSRPFVFLYPYNNVLQSTTTTTTQATPT